MAANQLVKDYSYIPGASYSVTSVIDAWTESAIVQSTIAFFPYDTNGYRPDWDTSAYVTSYYTAQGYEVVTITKVISSIPGALTPVPTADGGTYLTDLTTYWEVVLSQTESIYHPATTTTTTYTLPDQPNIDIGWSAEGVSLESAENTLVQFSVGDTSIGVVFGLGTTAASSGYNHIQRGWIFLNDSAQGIESGTIVGPTTPVAGTDIFAIQLAGGKVTLLKNGFTFYELTALSSGVSYQIFASLYVTGDAVYDAATYPLHVASAAGAGVGAGSAVTQAAATAAGSGVGYGRVTSYSTDLSGTVTHFTYAEGAGIGDGAAVATVSATATGAAAGAGSTTTPDVIGAVVSFPDLVASGSQDVRAEGIFSLPQILIQADQTQLAPAYAVGTVAVPALTTSGSGYSVAVVQSAGDATVSMPALDVLGSETVYGEGVVSIGTPVISAGAHTASAMMFGFYNSYSGSGTAYVHRPNSMAGTVDITPAVQMLGGAVMRGNAPAFTLAATATVPHVGRVTVTADIAPTVSAHAYVGVSGDVSGTVDITPTFAGYGGAVMVGEYSTITLSSTATVGVVGRVDATLQLQDYVSISAHANVPNTGSVNVTYDLAPYMSHAHMLATFDLSAKVYSYAYPTVSTNTAYIVTASNGATTTFSNYGFDSMGMLGDGETYMVGADGVYVHGGDLDATATINAVVTTGDWRFGEQQFKGWYEHAVKRMPYLYVSSYNTNNIKVTQYADQVRVNTYTSSLGDRRIQCSKGAKGVHWQLKFENINGGTLNLHRLELLVEQLSRRI